jgi:hypothetical protein
VSEEEDGPKMDEKKLMIEDNTQERNIYLGLEVLTAVVMKSSIFWDVIPCHALKINHCFRGMFDLHLHIEE